MSSALLRQALEFVDQEGIACDKKKSRRAVRHPPGQERRVPEGRVKKRTREPLRQEGGPSTEDRVRRLLALSAPVADSTLTDKIVERAVKGKPLSEYIEVKQHEEEKSILFPEESFTKFEEELFCS